MQKIGIITLLIFIIVLPIALKETSQHQVSTKGNGLIIITAHNEQIRFEITQAYRKYRAKNNLKPIQIDWRTSGSASQWRRQIIKQFKKAHAQNTLDQGIGVDLFFGGGNYQHNKLAQGFKITNQKKTTQIRILQPINLSQQQLLEIFPQEKIGNNRLYHPKKLWAGIVLSSFGIVYNKDVIKALHCPPPTTWRHLTNPKYQNWIALADPALSGSTNATYNTILQRKGWTQGWIILQEMMANARYFTTSSTKIPLSVTSANAAAGMCIDFYGRFQESNTPDQRIQFISPHQLTNITPDPVSILRGAPHQKNAQDFVAWLLSKQGQLLWQKKRHTRHGPEKFELRRLPIRQDLYAHTKNWTDPHNPFTDAKALPPYAGNFFIIIPHIAHAMAIDTHQQLKQAWDAILKQKNKKVKAKMKQRLHRLPPELTLKWPPSIAPSQSYAILQNPQHPQYPLAKKTIYQFYQKLNQISQSPAQLARKQAQWTQFFIQNYNAVRQIPKNYLPQ